MGEGGSSELASLVVFAGGEKVDVKGVFVGLYEEGLYRGVEKSLEGRSLGCCTGDGERVVERRGRMEG
jgi:hypothetical protein